jgi:hypothetical protein
MRVDERMPSLCGDCYVVECWGCVVSVVNHFATYVVVHDFRRGLWPEHEFVVFDCVCLGKELDQTRQKKVSVRV